MDDELGRLIKKAIGEIPKANRPNPYIEMAEQCAMMYNAFAAVGFSSDQCYELASNILLLQVEAATSQERR